MKRPVKLICGGIVLVVAAFGVSRLCLRAQQSPDADWSVTQKRMANIAWALVGRQYDESHAKQPNRDRWPRTLRPRSLWRGISFDMVWQDEWNLPFVYCPYGDTSDPFAEKQEGKRLPAKLIGKQILDRDHPEGGKWHKGEGNWEPDGTGPSRWMRQNAGGSSTHTGIWIEFVELVSYGKDGEPGGEGEDKDIVLRMYDSRDSDREQRRTGGEFTRTRTISWEFVEE